MQLVIDQKTKQIICTNFGQGHCHDFSLFKKSKIHFHPQTDSLQDSGYQGIKDYHAQQLCPQKETQKWQYARI
nr:hypothetical protein [Planktothrix tepida]